MKGTYRGKNLLNVRAGASASAPIVATLSPGESVNVKGVANGWAVTDEGYIMACKLDIEQTADDARAELESLKVAELRVIAYEKGIHLEAGMKKADIVEALL